MTRSELLRLVVERTIVLRAYVTHTGRCPFEDYFNSRPKREKNKIQGRLEAFAIAGCWEHRNNEFFKRLKLFGRVANSEPIFEIKNYQDRVLLIRDGNDAVLLKGIVKKDDWSKRDARELENAAKMAVDYRKRGTKR